MMSVKEFVKPGKDGGGDVIVRKTEFAIELAVGFIGYREEDGRDACVLQGIEEVGGGDRAASLFSRVSDEERWNTLTSGYMPDGGHLLPEFGIVTEGLPVDLTADLPGHVRQELDQIVGLGIKRDDALDILQRKPLGVKMGFIRAEEGDHVRTGRVSKEDEARGITAMLFDVLPDPCHGAGYILHLLAHLHFRNQTIVDRDEDKSMCVERGGFDVHAELVTAKPTPTMDEDHDGEIRSFYGVDVQALCIRACRGFITIADV